MRIFILLAFLLALLFCPSLVFAIPSSAKAAQASESSVLKFGALLTFTGAMATWGADAKDGLIMAQERLNADPNQSRKVSIKFEDWGNFDLKGAASAAHKFISVDQVDGVLALFTEDAETVWQIAANRSVPLIVIAAGAEDLTTNRPNVFRFSPADSNLMLASISYLQQREFQQPCVFLEEYAYFLGMEEVLSKEFANTTSQNPTRKLISLSSAIDHSDYRTAITKLKSAGCDALFVLLTPQAIPIYLKQAKQQHFTPIMFGVPSMLDPVALQASGEAAQGLIVAKYTAESEWFKREFTERFGRAPAIAAAYAYDALMVTASNMRKPYQDSGVSAAGEGDTSKEKLAQFSKRLSQLTNYPGASGPISISAERARSPRPIEIWQVKDGVPVVVQRYTE